MGRGCVNTSDMGPVESIHISLLRSKITQKEYFPLLPQVQIFEVSHTFNDGKAYGSGTRNYGRGAVY